MTELNQKLEQAQKPSIVHQYEQNLRNWWKIEGPNITRLAGSPEEAKRLYATALQVAQRQPQLFDATWQSVALCLLQSATLKLYPGPLGECAYVPFMNGRTRRREAQWIPMYPGLIKLAYNSGVVKRIAANVVWEADEFRYSEGLNQELYHRPSMEDERGERICVYALVETRYGATQVAVMSKRSIESIKARSKGAGKSDSPWNSNEPDDIDEMWKKSAVKRVLKYIPKSADLVTAIEADNAAERPDLVKREVVDITAMTAPAKRDESIGQIVDLEPEPEGEEDGKEKGEDSD